MAPEALDGDCPTIDRRSDLFSFGVTLYEMCRGSRPPRLAIDRGAIDINAVGKQLRWSRFHDVILKLLDTNPARRFSSAKEAADAIKRIHCFPFWLLFLLLLLIGIAGWVTTGSAKTRINLNEITLPEVEPAAIAKPTVEPTAEPTGTGRTNIRIDTTQSAWAAFTTGEKAYDAKDFDGASPNLKKAVDLAKKVVFENAGGAMRNQASLKTSGEPLPPEGTIVDEAQRKAVFARGQLNDVAVCLWIIGRASQYLGDYDVARHAYVQTALLTYGRAHDPAQDTFWDPSQKAKDDLRVLQGEPPPQPTPWLQYVMGVVAAGGAVGLLWASAPYVRRSWAAGRSPPSSGGIPTTLP